MNYLGNQPRKIPASYINLPTETICVGGVSLYKTLQMTAQMINGNGVNLKEMDWEKRSATVVHYMTPLEHLDNEDVSE